ncbi:MAG: TatD family hydrolase [Pseudomonadota bacterium]
MHLIDSHAHLDMLDHLPLALDHAAEAGVVQIVTIGVDLKSSQAAVDLAGRHAHVFATVGLHPHDAEQADAAFWAGFEALARSGRPVAIGECGLDFYRDLSPRPAQREAFARQVELAKSLKLPLVIHDRDAHAETAAMLTDLDAGQVGGVLHCFSGGADLARAVLDLGFYLGITGVITYKNAEPLREVARQTPLERLVIETDCPFLTPEPHRGRPNQPAYVAHTCAGLAKALGRPAEEVAEATTANARRLFGLPGGED